MIAGTNFLQPRPKLSNLPPPGADPLTTQYNLYNTGVEQNAEDYGSIMQGYKSLINKTQGPNAHYDAAMNNLATLSGTGGYSDADKADLRARGVSPIRSIYAGANRDIDRQRSLQGGYSPNYGALKTKMARDLSESIGGQVSNVNADIASKVAQNKVGLAGTYANAAQQGNTAATQALSGATSLYGTTPALASTFGNQALQGAQLQNQITQGKNQQGLQAISQGIGGIRRR